jgi:Tfp pilus assembly protein PilZ
MEDKRRSPRVDLTVRMDCYDILEAKTLKAESKNISASGIGITTRETLSMGRHVQLIFALPDKSRIAAIAEVKWCKPVGTSPGLFASGLRFTDIKEQDVKTISKFVEAQLFGPGYHQEKRVARRVVVALTVNFLSVEAVTRNLSETGMCIQAEESFPEKTQAQIMFFLPTNTCINVVGEIVWKKKITGNLIEYGINFLSLGKNELARIREFVSGEADEA